MLSDDHQQKLDHVHRNKLKTKTYSKPQIKTVDHEPSTVPKENTPANEVIIAKLKLSYLKINK